MSLRHAKLRLKELQRMPQVRADPEKMSHYQVLMDLTEALEENQAMTRDLHQRVERIERGVLGPVRRVG